LRALILALVVVASPACKQRREPVPEPPPSSGTRFRIKLVAGEPFAGRLLILADPSMQGELSRANDRRAFPAEIVIAADVELAPGGEVVVDARRSAPPLDEVVEARYRIEAVLDRGGDFAVGQAGPGDVIGRPVVQTLPLEGEIALVLDDVVEARRLRPPRGVAEVEVASKLLAGRPQAAMHAAAALPPGKRAEPWPVVYEILDGDGTAAIALKAATLARRSMEAGTLPEMVYVMVSAATPAGHSGMVDSECLGPWGRAFVEELVPAVEAQLPIARAPERRALAGHGAGGRAALSLMLQHPDAFAGAWATAPWWPDLRDVFGASLAPGSADNLYKLPDGSARLSRRAVGGRPQHTVEAMLRREAMIGGGRFASLEHQLSPCGDDGRARPVVDRATGALVEEVVRAWQPRDLRARFLEAWPRAGASLYGKLHLRVGEHDDFFLERSVKLFCDELAARDAGARCDVVPGRAHDDLRSLDRPQEGPGSPVAAEIAAALAR
jgi:hypothetical protein